MAVGARFPLNNRHRYRGNHESVFVLSEAKRRSRCESFSPGTKKCVLIPEWDCCEGGLGWQACAFAKAGYSAPELFEVMAVHSAHRAGEFDSGNVARLLTAYATAAHPAPDVFDAMAEQASARPSRGVGVSNM